MMFVVPLVVVQYLPRAPNPTVGRKELAQLNPWHHYRRSVTLLLTFKFFSPNILSLPQIR